MTPVLSFLGVPRVRGTVLRYKREETAGEMRRSLIFHCYPKLGEDWQKVCLATFKYRNVFNGRLLVSIMSGNDCEQPLKVIEWFQQFGPELEYRIIPNVKGKGLNTTFRDQLQAIRYEKGIVFKAHTKGISHANDPFGQWRQNMADGCLSDIGLVEQTFRDGFRTFGVYKTLSPEGAVVMGQTEGTWKTAWDGWHYPGAFFWFDPQFIPDSFFALPEHYYENEAFPCHLGPTEAGFSLRADNFIFVSADVAPYFRELNTPLYIPSLNKTFGARCSMHKERTDCRCCRSPNLSEVFSLGEQPYANAFLANVDDVEVKSPLVLMECEDCRQVQLKHVVEASHLYRNYSFMTSSSRSMSEHFADLMEVSVERYVERGGLVVEIGSNDGTALSSIQRTDVRRIGIDPAENLTAIAAQRGVRSLTKFFNEAAARELVDEHGQADLVAACNVLGHIDDLEDFCHGMQTLLSRDGRLIVEVPYVDRLLEDVEFSTIYHEHLSYFSVRPLKALFRRYGLYVNRVEQFEVHGGTIRLTVSRDGQQEACEQDNESRDWDGFNLRSRMMRVCLLDWLTIQRYRGLTVWGYGAPAKGSVLLNYCGIGCDLMPVVVDSTPTKQGKYMPGTHQLIVDPSKLLSAKPDAAVVLAWNHYAEIEAKEAEYLAGGGKLFLPTMDVRIGERQVDTLLAVN